jgi:transcriptional regulator with XRE-family HTH domain
LRLTRDLKLYDLAAHLRVDPATIHRWERGESPVPDWAKLALSEFYEVDPARLMGWDEVAA